jgi:hypothetical protein
LRRAEPAPTRREVVDLAPEVAVERIVERIIEPWSLAAAVEARRGSGNPP